MSSDDGRKPSPKHLEPNYDRYRRSKKHEERLGKRLGGKRLPRSGGVAWSKWDKSTLKGDISIPLFHIEHKRTDLGSMSIQRDWLKKVSEGARRMGKDPGVICTFENRPEAPQEWALIPLSAFEHLLALAQEKEK